MNSKPNIGSGYHSEVRVALALLQRRHAEEKCTVDSSRSVTNLKIKINFWVTVRPPLIRDEKDT